ncbi:DUF4433 domain-containing protein [Pseudoxanthomonas sp. CF125]|uniref:type II toxin-antitoxin system toxin DNA ADP-ribosyl transferase DarT n=1 Tax=Pseudoxanthomonas sp. CF125 TaxID=1855303 RepID=UPI000883980A|nr:DUF4433 domain-containing protein [Pseudoxanthomonas sp. CF125]SDQ75667.1 protein of unknown function [Pseudoxanthomonas sp. CF125]
MTLDINNVQAYHITDIENLPGIFASGGLLSDLALGPTAHSVIGYSHIKQRRMTVLRVPCCTGQPFVGAFVPFYYCPRSPMLFTVNKGSTGKPAGCQGSIVHLVTNVSVLTSLGSEWAISDGNAGAAHALFANSLTALKKLDWAAIRTSSWAQVMHQKAAEFLVRDFVPWNAVQSIGCFDAGAVAKVTALLTNTPHRPLVSVQRAWYY